jgi:hypothetical protein
MLLSRPFKALTLTLLTVAFVHATTAGATAGPLCGHLCNKVKYCHFKPTDVVLYSPFFGYYPTCWRPFPGGQPPCPPPCGAVEGIAPAEQLPPPVEEKAPAKDALKEPKEVLPTPKPDKLPK